MRAVLGEGAATLHSMRECTVVDEPPTREALSLEGWARGMNSRGCVCSCFPRALRCAVSLGVRVRACGGQASNAAAAHAAKGGPAPPHAPSVAYLFHPAPACGLDSPAAARDPRHLLALFTARAMRSVHAVASRLRAAGAWL